MTEPTENDLDFNGDGNDDTLISSVDGDRVPPLGSPQRLQVPDQTGIDSLTTEIENIYISRGRGRGVGIRLGTIQTRSTISHSNHRPRTKIDDSDANANNANGQFDDSTDDGAGGRARVGHALTPKVQILNQTPSSNELENLLLGYGQPHPKYWYKDLRRAEGIVPFCSSTFMILGSFGRNVFYVVPTSKMRGDVLELVDQINLHLYKVRRGEKEAEAQSKGLSGKIKVKPEIGEVILVPHGKNQYYRAYVRAYGNGCIDQSTIEVYFVDTGRTKCLNWSECYPLTYELAQIPILCYKFKLTNVEDTNALILDSEFKELVCIISKLPVKLFLRDLHPSDCDVCGEIHVNKRRLGDLINVLAIWEWEHVYNLGNHTDLDIIKKRYMNYDTGLFDFQLGLENFDLPKGCPVEVDVLERKIAEPVPTSQNTFKSYITLYCKPNLKCIRRMRKTLKAQLDRYVQRVQATPFNPAICDACLFQHPTMFNGAWVRAYRAGEDCFYFPDYHYFKNNIREMESTKEKVQYRYLCPDFYKIPRLIVEVMIQIEAPNPVDNKVLEDACNLVGKSMTIFVNLDQTAAPLADQKTYIAVCPELNNLLASTNII